jgi:sugar/nucleoside kinase (ribokinase family)
VGPLAVIGHLALDSVSGASPRIGGAPWYAGRAIKLLGRRATIVAKCGQPERRQFLMRLESLGLPVSLVAGGSTAAFSFDYDGDARRMAVAAIGEPWTPEEALGAVDRAEWLHVAPLLRSDFPRETLAELARGRRLLLDGQGLVRRPQTGALVLDDDFDPALFENVSILKLAEEEALTLVGSLDAVPELGVPEIVVTLGAEGCVVFDHGRAERIPAQTVHGVLDPTGAGDAFAATYLSARARGRTPALAAWRASALVAGLLAQRTRL